MVLTILAFVLVLGLLVFVHEFGHFISAKRLGIQVDEFGFGFPPRIFGVKKGGTLYSLNLIPLGGFVKIKGELGDSASDTDSFAHRSATQRVGILAAGVMMNFILAFFLLSIGFLSGVPQAVSDKDIQTRAVRDVRLVIIDVNSKSAADRAGIQPGDQLLSIDDQTFATPADVASYIQAHGDSTMRIAVERGAQRKDFTAHPEPYEGVDYPILGIGTIRTGLVRYGFWESWDKGSQETIGLIVAVVMALVHMISSIVMGKGIGSQVSGPVGVAVLTGQIAQLGFAYLINFTAMLSVNLGVLNSIPFPALDGGRILFVLIEKIKGRAISPRIESTFHQIGFVLLIILVIFVTYQDLTKYGYQIISGIQHLWS